MLSQCSVCVGIFFFLFQIARYCFGSTNFGPSKLLPMPNFVSAPGVNFTVKLDHSKTPIVFLFSNAMHWFPTLFWSPTPPCPPHIWRKSEQRLNVLVEPRRRWQPNVLTWVWGWFPTDFRLIGPEQHTLYVFTLFSLFSHQSVKTRWILKYAYKFQN